MNQSQRSSGLDTLRACAILGVFFSHYPGFSFGWLSTTGWVGVDLFFVLSGYLIGNQIFTGLARGQPLDTTVFYARRALRTWPAFWFVLAAYFLFPSWMGGTSPPALWRFLTFTQNIGLHTGTAFSHAWSLCVEEQFYLAFPLVVWLGLRLGARRSHGWALLGGLLAVGVISRVLLWNSYARTGQDWFNNYYPNIYYATLCRFDELLPGLAVAMVKNFHPDAWARITQRGQTILVTGLLATGTMVFCIGRYFYDYGFLTTAFGYSLMALSFAVLVVAALSPGSTLYRLRIPGAYQIALWSYSIYLSHKAVFHIVQLFTKPRGVPPAATVVVAVIASGLCGAGLYWLVEAPFMALRERTFPSLFRRFDHRPSPEVLACDAGKRQDEVRSEYGGWRLVAGSDHPHERAPRDFGRGHR
jgi:peptidoglycan/LPS O-acetylase OafA/YrhL